MLSGPERTGKHRVTLFWNQDTRALKEIREPMSSTFQFIGLEPFSTQYERGKRFFSEMSQPTKSTMNAASLYLNAGKTADHLLSDCEALFYYSMNYVNSHKESDL